MRLVVTSDLHGNLPKINSCDILIIAGDIFCGCDDRNAKAQEIWYNSTFLPWIKTLPCRHVVLTPGNHDYFLEAEISAGRLPVFNLDDKLIILCNSGVEIDGLSIYGTPNTPPPRHNFAFCQTDDDLKKTFSLIPDQLDILVSHAAPQAVGKLAVVEDDLDVGCKELTEALRNRNIRYVFCGHVHNGGHERTVWEGKVLYNVSLCDNRKEIKYSLLEINIPDKV